MLYCTPGAARAFRAARENVHSCTSAARVTSQLLVPVMPADPGTRKSSALIGSIGRWRRSLPIRRPSTMHDFIRGTVEVVAVGSECPSAVEVWRPCIPRSLPRRGPKTSKSGGRASTANANALGGSNRNWRRVKVAPASATYKWQLRGRGAGRAGG